MKTQKLFKKVMLKGLAALPIVSIAFAAQSALAIDDFDALAQNTKFIGKSLFIDGVEYNLQRVLKAPVSEYVGDVSVEFIQDYTDEIVNGEVEGIEIDDSILMAKESGSISGWH